MTNNSKTHFLDRLRALAQQGLNYSSASFDKERYGQLLALAAEGYTELLDLPVDIITSRLEAEFGHITPKVGVNGAIFSTSGSLFLTQRSDDKCWELPGGWVEVGESPQEALVREFAEETSTSVNIERIIEVFSRKAGDFGQAHSSCHLLFLCRSEHIGTGFSHEVTDKGFFDQFDTLAWHRDHRKMADAARAFWRQSGGRTNR